MEPHTCNRRTSETGQTGNCEFNTNLGYVVSSRPVWTIELSLASKIQMQVRHGVSRVCYENERTQVPTPVPT